MGQLDILKSFLPENITPQGATGNPLEYYEQRPVSPGYPSPEILAGNYWQMGPFTPAGIYEVNGVEFLQDKWHWPSANTQMVTAPDRPVDKGTYDAIGGTMKTGIYLQYNQIGTTKQVAGSAPTTGVYTGFYGVSGEYEGGC